MSTTPTTNFRPYTSYNLFFQLEREYILQNLLGYQPAIAAKDKFDRTADQNYQGPPLPSRYASIILPYDWYIPGKTQRRNKRSHRKSHGKIGFCELNQQISKAWKMVVDDDTRNFCMGLSVIESRRYKKINEGNKVETTTTTTTKRRWHKDDKVTMKQMIEKQTKNDSGCKKKDFVVPPVHFPQDSSSPFPEIGRTVSHESLHDVLQKNLSQGTTTSDSKLRDSSVWTEVDMHDDEIMEIWESTPVDDEDDGIYSIICQICAEIPDHPSSSS